MKKSGKVYVTQVHTAAYDKQLGKIKTKVKERVDINWNENGLDTCKHVGTKIWKELQQEGVDRKVGTIIDYTRDARTELYGIPFVKSGKIGSCTYLWCKKDNYDNPIPLTAAEQKIKEDLMIKYFGNTTEKQILVKGMVMSGEIKVEEAWEVLEEMTNMKDKSFKDFLWELNAEIGSVVIRGTLVDRSSATLS